MTFKPDWQADLDEYDRREAEIAHKLQEQKPLQSKTAYQAMERAYAKERANMAKRRPLLEAWIKQDKEQD